MKPLDGLALFDFLDRCEDAPAIYPNAPGFKGPRGGTSHEAAETIMPALGYFRKLVLDEYEAIAPWGATSDEIAQRLNLSVLQVRPRVSELGRLGLIIQTAERRENASGMSARVWKAAPAKVEPISPSGSGDTA
jgi:sugar/nucleoside kinase (ribokinase family)